ncbi:SPOR domain-containing protein [Rubellimicrobium arenae]|uniref:SPOR domain-containing protein n=1 Tax=Rubellimicrobium arenae TaxID=2817372 RepID=UPI001B30D959|nr:SPOR domain-containing protein [Rubellimicrobium arenae]
MTVAGPAWLRTGRLFGAAVALAAVTGVTIAQVGPLGRWHAMACAGAPAKPACLSQSSGTSSASLRRTAKAATPLPPRHGPEGVAPARPAWLDPLPDPATARRIVAPSPDPRPAAAMAVSAHPARTGPVETAALQTVPRPAPVSGGGGAAHRDARPVYVQVGAYAQLSNVQRTIAALRALGFAVGLRDGFLAQVAAGPFATSEDAQAALRTLHRAGFPDAYVTR